MNSERIMDAIEFLGVLRARFSAIANMDVEAASQMAIAVATLDIERIDAVMKILLGAMSKGSAHAKFIDWYRNVEAMRIVSRKLEDLMKSDAMQKAMETNGDKEFYEEAFREQIAGCAKVGEVLEFYAEGAE